MNRKHVKGLAIAAGILAFVLIFNILALTVFDAILSNFFGGMKIYSKEAELDGNYYTTPHANLDEVRTAEEEMNERAVGEGIVLLKYDEKSRLPYAPGTTFSLFSHSSVDMIYGGTGSGSVGGNKVDIKTAFEERGLKINETLWSFYESGAGASYTRGSGSYDFGMDEFYSIHECPLSVIQGDKAVMDSLEGTVAVFVISRTGGEGRDLPRSMVEHADNPVDKAKHYLEPDTTELEILSYLNDNFEDVLVLLNCNNAFEMGWVEAYENIRTVLSVPGTGITGMYALPDILLGNVNPSGHTVDTYAYDFFSSPAAQNCDETVCYIDGSAPTGGGDSGFGEDEYIYFTAYEEGIYVGYKYYETRYEDYILSQGNAGAYDYAATVQYPFGFGLSRTEFAWSDYQVSWEGDTCTVSVTVTNTGDIAGKDVVQVYIQKPYTQHDVDNRVEKAAVELAGFVKTKLLQPGEGETVTASFDKSLFASYDYTKAKTYIVDEGTYYITVATDAHAAINNILLAKAPETAERLIASPSEKKAGNKALVAAYEQEAFDKETYSLSCGTEVTNRLDFASREDMVYLSRSNWEGTYPTPYGTLSDMVCTYGNRVNGGTEEDPQAYVYRVDITREEYEAVYSTDSLNPIDDSVYTEAPVFGSREVDIELIELRGAAYDDPRWDTLLSRLSTTEVTDTINISGYGTRKMTSISKPADRHSDGPSGFKAITGNDSVDGYGFMCGVTLAQTWNKELAREKGELMGEESLLRTGNELNGWYGPGLNIHRTPFSGRNFEYYSEDAIMSGLLGQQEVVGAARYGLNAYPKHFAFNDSETHRGDKTGEHRMGDWGICTWLNEQSAREIYLKAFELVAKSGTVTEKYYGVDENGDTVMMETEVPAMKGMMTSFNRIGFTWTGGCYPLIQNIVRGEWGFNGYIVTDFDNGTYMDTLQMLRAGGDAKLVFFVMPAYDGTNFKVESNVDKATYHYVKEAMHHVLYAAVNSSGVNGVTKGATVETFAYYKFILMGIDAAALIAMVIIVIHTFKKPKGKKSEEGEEPVIVTEGGVSE